MLSSVTAVAATGGAMLVMWWKVKNDNAEIRREVSDHAEKIMFLITDKANCADLLKLADVVDKLDRRIGSELDKLITKVDEHHIDTRRHRTEDFEARIDGLIATVHDMSKENRADHERIIALIEKKT
jgi:hypothetical protein